MLMELGGAQVFMDWRSISPGSEWSAALEHALADCDMLCVFWSAAAQRSTWVRAEYTTFIARFPDRPCVPLPADETPLPLLLEKRQAPSEFLALASEMVALRRDLVARGVSRREIRRVVQARIAQLGLQLDDAQRSKLLGLFVSGASIGVLLSWLARPVKITAVMASVASVVSLVTVVSLVWRWSSTEPGPGRQGPPAQHAAPVEREPVRRGGMSSAEDPAGTDGGDAKQAPLSEGSNNQSAMSVSASQGSGAPITKRPTAQLRDDTGLPEETNSHAVPFGGDGVIMKARRLLESREAVQGIAWFLHKDQSLRLAEYMDNWHSGGSAEGAPDEYRIRYIYYWNSSSLSERADKTETVLDFYFDQQGVVQSCSVAVDYSSDPTFSRSSRALHILAYRLQRDPEARRHPEITKAAEQGDAASVMLWLLRTGKMSWVLGRR